MERSKVVIVGHSHLQAVMGAYQSQPSGAHGPFDLACAQLLRPELPYMIELDGRMQYNPVLTSEIEEFLTREHPDLIVLMLEGQQAAEVGFSWPTRPFDFHLPDEPPNSLKGCGENVPYDMVLEFARGRMGLMNEFLTRIQCKRYAPCIAISPPPLVGDNEHVIGKLMTREEFRGLYETFGMPPVQWRRKVWTILVTAMREVYQAHGASFVPAPDMAKDENGFLKPEYFSDAFHGNDLYGGLVLRQIQESLARVNEKEAA